jgi:hypothetical protein
MISSWAQVLEHAHIPPSIGCGKKDSLEKVGSR